MKKKILILIILLFAFTIKVDAAEIKIGTYKIVSGLDNNKILVEKNNNIVLGTDKDTGNILWDIYSTGTTYYIRSHKNNNYSIDLSGAIASNGRNIQLYKKNTSKAQIWKFNYQSNEYYQITTVLGNYNLDVKGANSNSGTNIQLYKNNTSKAQIWKFVRVDKPQKTIEDGTYIIKSSNSNFVFDLVGAKTDNKTNIQLYSNNFSWAQVWNIKYENGYYRITSYLDKNKSLDITGAKFKIKNNIELYQSNSSLAQKFLIEKKGNNYNITSFDGLWSIDVVGSSFKNGVNIQLYGRNTSNAQKFTFEKVNIDPLKTGSYFIYSKVADNKVVGVNNPATYNNKNVDLRKKENRNYNKWYIKKIKDDIYTIASGENNNFVLDVAGAKKEDGTNVQLYKANGKNNQKWSIRKNDDGTYKIISIDSGKSLDVKGGKSEDGTNIQVYSANTSKAQKFEIETTTLSKYSRAYDDGKYIIKSNINKNMVVDLYGGYKDNNTNIETYSSNSSKAQLWTLNYLGDGEYVIRSAVNPNLVLSFVNNNVVSAKYTGSNNQKWYFDKSGDITNIINMSNGKYLYINSNKPANKTNISLSDKVSNQTKFVLEKYTSTIKYKGIDISVHNSITSWDKISKAVDFVVIRAGFSDEVLDTDKTDRYEDKKYIENVKNCEKYNIPYALYLYSYANKLNDSDNPSYNKGAGSSADSEANHMIKLISKIKKLGFTPTLSTKVYYDQEEDKVYTTIRDYYKESNSNHSKTKILLTNMVNRFCSKLNKQGYKCGVYSSSYWLDYNLNVKDIANNYAIWVAQWPGYNTFDKGLNNKTSYTTTAHKIWQFSSEGSVSGISGDVDMDIGYNIFD